MIGTKMNASEIVQKAAAQAGIDPNVALKASANLLRLKHMKLLKHNDSLMYYNIMGSRANVYIATADSQLNFLSALMYFKKFLIDNGVDIMYMDTKNPIVLKSLKSVGMQLEKSDDPTYQVMVKL